MSPTGRRHEVIREELSFRFTRAAPESVFISQVSQFNLSEDTYVVPDILVRPAAIKTYDLHGSDALLVVEVADTSLRYDLNTKAQLYALHGVPEYWVIHTGTLLTTVHRRPSASAYTEVTQISGDAELVS